MSIFSKPKFLKKKLSKPSTQAHQPTPAPEPLQPQPVEIKVESKPEPERLGDEFKFKSLMPMDLEDKIEGSIEFMNIYRSVVGIFNDMDYKELLVKLKNEIPTHTDPTNLFIEIVFIINSLTMRIRNKSTEELEWVPLPGILIFKQFSKNTYTDIDILQEMSKIDLIHIIHVIHDTLNALSGRLDDVDEDVVKEPLLLLHAFREYTLYLIEQTFNPVILPHLKMTGFSIPHDDTKPKKLLEKEELQRRMALRRSSN